MDIETISCSLQTFDKVPDNRIDDYEMDANESFVMSANFRYGALGVIHASRWATGLINELVLCVYAIKAGLWCHWHDGTSLAICAGGDVDTGTWQQIQASPARSTYHRFFDAVYQGKTLEPSFERAAKIQRLIDLSISSS